MSSSLLTLPTLLAGVMLVALTAYALLGGADFGGGVWDFFASGPRRAEQRELVAHAIGPIWEANHVWLILVVVLLFTCFPPAFAAVTIALHIPLSLMLVGIVLRGSAFTFRAYGDMRDEVSRRWGVIFSISSILTPVLLGVCIGAIASGEVVMPEGQSFLAAFVRPWLTPFALGVGALALALFAFLAATYLTVEAEGDAALQDDFRRRALLAAGAVFVAAFGTLALARERTAAPALGLMTLHPGAPWAMALHAATGIAAISAMWALVSRRFRLARIAAATQVTCILWGWAIAQYPYLVPGHATISASAAPVRTLRLVLGALVLGFVVLVPSLIYLFRVFKGGPAAPPGRLPAEPAGAP